MTEPEPPAEGRAADEVLRVRLPVAPDWFRVKVLSPMVTLADRVFTELVAAAFQLTVLPELDTVSQEGFPETVQVL